jgi:hypothetical protein
VRDGESINALRMQNQWKLNLQSKLKDIMRDVMAVDDKGTEKVDARDFMRILEVRLNGTIPQKANKE